MSYAVGELHPGGLVVQPITPASGINSDEWYENCAGAVRLANKMSKGKYKWRVIPQTHVMMGLK